MSSPGKAAAADNYELEETRPDLLNARAEEPAPKLSVLTKASKKPAKKDTVYSPKPLAFRADVIQDFYDAVELTEVPKKEKSNRYYTPRTPWWKKQKLAEYLVSDLPMSAFLPHTALGKKVRRHLRKQFPWLEEKGSVPKYYYYAVVPCRDSVRLNHNLWGKFKPYTPPQQVTVEPKQPGQRTPSTNLLMVMGKQKVEANTKVPTP